MVFQIGEKVDSREGKQGGQQIKFPAGNITRENPGGRKESREKWKTKSRKVGRLPAQNTGNPLSLKHTHTHTLTHFGFLAGSGLSI